MGLLTQTRPGSEAIGRAIITHGRSLHSLVAAGSLGRQGVEVIGTDSVPMMGLSFSRHVKGTFLHPTIEEGPERFLDVLEEKVKEYRPENHLPYVLMPIGRHTRLIAENRHRFEPHIRLATPAIECINRVDPKDQLIRTAQGLGIPIPPTWYPVNEEELHSILPEVVYPAFVKLPDGTGGVGIEKVDTAEELEQAYHDMYLHFQCTPDRSPFIQQAVGEDDYCVTVLMQHGQHRASMVYRNLQQFPATGGFGVIRETVHAPQLVDLSTQLLGAIGWHGVAELDFRWDGRSDTQPYLIEVNPRFWGGLFQSVDSGVDYPWLLYQMTVQGEVDLAPAPAIGHRTRMPLVGVLAEIQDLAENDEGLQRVGEQFREGWDQLKGGSVWTGLGQITTAVASALNPVDRLQQVAGWLDTNRNVKTEIFSSDDPLPALGVLFVLGSLVRNGRLPEEIGRGNDTTLLENPYAHADNASGTQEVEEH